MFNRFAILATIAFALAACGGGGSGGKPASMMPQQPNMPVVDTGGEPAPYSVGVSAGNVVATPVLVSAEAVTVAGRTVAFSVENRVAPGHYRIFDTQGATHGPALDVHILGEDDGYNYVTFGTWAEGTVSPNPGFRISESFGAFAAPQSEAGLTPVSNLPVAGSATYKGSYEGWIDQGMSGVSRDSGTATMTVNFGNLGSAFGAYGYNGSMLVLLSSTDYHGLPVASVRLFGPINGNTFEADVTATETIDPGFGFPSTTVSRGDFVQITGVDPRYGLNPGFANSGGMQGGFYGNRGGEAAGTYQFTYGGTKAAGSFGGNLE